MTAVGGHRRVRPGSPPGSELAVVPASIEEQAEAEVAALAPVHEWVDDLDVSGPRRPPDDASALSLIGYLVRLWWWKWRRPMPATIAESPAPCMTAEQRWAASRGLPPRVRPPADGSRRD